MDMNKPEPKRLNAYEMASFEMLLALTSELAVLGKLEQRIKSVDGAWKLYKSALGMITKMIGNVLAETVPTEQIRRIKYTVENSTVQLKLRSITQTEGYRHLSDKEFNTLLSYIVYNECQMCLKEGEEIERCKLCKLFDSIGANVPDEEFSCKYSKFITGNGDDD